MSALSFVALSMQTTHLDPATVNKASYLKLVDGNITRVDAIDIIPPATQAETRTGHPPEAVSWEDALAQLSMVIGKLPIVSYYRDADKEIFQSASRRSGVTPPEFQWLDCRALARELLPELPEHQLSTVLKALDLYEEHADSRAVVQTAHVVLQLAQRHEATTVSELWGDLYDQPEDLLDLEATLEGLTALEVHTDDEEPAAETPSDENDPAPSPAAVDAAAIATPAVLPVTPLDDPQDAEPGQSPSAETPEPLAPVSHDDDFVAEASESHTSPLVEEEPDHEPTSADSTADQLSAGSSEATDDRPDDDTADDDLGDSTAQSVIEREHLDQPEFLRVTDDEDPDFDEWARQEPIERSEESDELEPSTEPIDAEHFEAAIPQDPEPLQETEDPQAASPQPQAPAPADNAEPQIPTVAVPTVTGQDELRSDHDDSTHSDDAEISEHTSAEPAAHTRPFDPVDQSVAPPPEIRTGSTSAAVTTLPAETGYEHWSTVEESPRRRSKASRVWGLLGLILFGLLTVLGLVLTVMATLLFFTTNTLLLETKIAGVVLTSAITLLSLLMAVLSYRSYRKK